MGVVRHPFDAGPWVAVPAGTAPIGYSRRLDEQDQVWVRGLRPEARAVWLATGGSALASIAVYLLLWNAEVACGLVLGMWVHELGHQLVIRRLRLDASPIVFVPFVGAMQRLRTPPASALDGARIALAGPLCGLSFALACKLAYLATGHAELGFLATAHALLAMLDAVPFGVLDGRRIFAALTRRQRAGCACACMAVALVTQALYLVPVVVAIAWTATQPAPSRCTMWVPGVYVALLAAGAWLV